MKNFLLTLSLIAVAAVAACKKGETAVTFPKTVHYQCGAAAVTFTLLDEDRADMKMANASYALVRAISASGAKYGAVGDDTTYLWNKGTKATVSLRGETLPECEETSAAAGDAEWVLETQGGAGGRVTIRFGKDGRVSGSSGCNNYSGGYTRDGAKLEIAKNMISTRRACLSGEIMAQEQKFLETLPAMTAYAEDDSGALVLSGGGRQLVFRRK